ncbi:MAG: hypothetical protein R2743_02710 [Ilumatobacteraceae bacterium]
MKSCGSVDAAINGAAISVRPALAAHSTNASAVASGCTRAVVEAIRIRMRNGKITE